MDSKINNKEIVGIVIDELEKRSIIKKNYSTIIASLEAGGIFLLKGAVKDVADALHCSPAGAYRYLSQIKKDEG